MCNIGHESSTVCKKYRKPIVILFELIELIRLFKHVLQRHQGIQRPSVGVPSIPYNPSSISRKPETDVDSIEKRHQLAGNVDVRYSGIANKLLLIQ